VKMDPDRITPTASLAAIRKAALATG
jgi:hypothetical protein